MCVCARVKCHGGTTTLGHDRNVEWVTGGSGQARHSHSLPMRRANNRSFLDYFNRCTRSRHRSLLSQLQRESHGMRDGVRLPAGIVLYCFDPKSSRPVLHVLVVDRKVS